MTLTGHARAPGSRAVLTARLLITALALITTLAVPPTRAAAQHPDPAAIDAIFAEFDRPGSPGCALGVMKDGVMLYARGYGYANLDWDIPITPETVFYVGSVSKQFTAAAILLLARDGVLSLDDPVRRWLPELPARVYGPVRIRHMIHHISGIPDTYAAMGAAGIPVADVFSDSAAVALMAAQDSLNFTPGDRYMYSNGAYFLLSEVVARASGMSFSDFTRERIFEPLWMNHSHFHNDAGHIVEHRAMSYERDRDGGFVQSYMSNFDKVGAGGLYTNLRDLLKWDLDFYQQKVGGPGFTQARLQRGVLNDGDTLDYAFGLQVGEHNGHRMIGHTGSMMGFKADLIRFPDERLSVAITCNLGSVRQRDYTLPVADLFLPPSS